MARFAPLDWLTVSYAGCSGLVLLYRAFGTSVGFPLRDLAWLLVAHALLVVLVFLASTARQRCPTQCLLSEWYPLVVLVAVYASVGMMNAPQAAAGLS